MNRLQATLHNLMIRKLGLPLIIVILASAWNRSYAQAKQSIAVSNTDTRGVEIDPLAMGNLVRIEVERFSDKLVISMRLFDVKKGTILNTDISEFQYAPNETDLMIQISINNILNLENDPNLVSLNGPRIDSRGTVKLGSRWIWAVGKTFRSGYLNIPVNIYFSAPK